MSKQDNIEIEGTVVEALPNAAFKVKLENGTIGRAKVTFDNPETHYQVYFNGVNQDEYANIRYAG